MAYTGLPVRDTDTDVEAMSGRTITDIFTQDGEAVFRELEVSAVTAALAEHRGVLALGGGAVMNPVCVSFSPAVGWCSCVCRCRSGVRRTGLAATRPLLVGVNPRATYKALLDARLPIYREVATLEVDTDDLSVDQVAQVITAEFGL